jgi:3-dehydroquinate dehydratase/shikimate dehydrogenase
MTKIIASIRPKNFEDGEDLILSAQIAGAEMIEIWCDKMDLADLKKLVIISELPVMVNLKDKSEKGLFTGTMFERIKFLEALINEGAAYLDLPFSEELSAVDLDRFKGKLVISAHDFEQTPSLDEIENLIGKILKLNPAILKLAFKVNKEIDLVNLFQLQVSRRELWGKSVILGMGQKGAITRVMSKMFQHPFTFASIDRFSRTAPGQMTIEQLNKIWRKFGFK